MRVFIDIEPQAVQRIVPQRPAERFEGIAFSASGDTMAVATSDTNAVLLFRRTGDRFADTPRQTLGHDGGGLDYPHDVAFSRCGSDEFLAVAQRQGAIVLYRMRAEGCCDPEPALEISGPNSRLAFSDGVAFVPRDGACIAACNLTAATIAFFPRISVAPLRFAAEPAFELRHAHIFDPDGLAFSGCGRWLAVANHGNETVSIFRRGLGRRFRYGPQPVTVIRDPRLRFPHSVAFTPLNNLIVTSAGANYFTVYRPRRTWRGWRWAPDPVAQVMAHEDATFREVNTAIKSEGGPKGVAIHGDRVAICSPQIGVKFFAFREGWRKRQ